MRPLTLLPLALIVAARPVPAADPAGELPPTLAPFFVGSILVWASMSAVMTFIALQVVALGGGGPLIALPSSLGALTEVPVMLAFPVLARRFSPAWLVVAGAAAIGGRALGWALAPDPISIALIAHCSPQ